MKAEVRSGIDRMETAEDLLRSGRIGLMTNQTGMDHFYRSSIDLLHERYHLTALFAVEHGIRGDLQAGAAVTAYRDGKTGLTVWPVYGGNHRLTAEMLAEFDVFCFDLQDVGLRFYTYLYALSLAMEECCRAGKPVVIFDRLNPLGGEKVQGTVLNPAFASYVGMYPLPTRYGLTIGEYALWVKRHLGLKNLELRVVPLSGWRRSMMPWETDIPWAAPSPNCPAWHSAFAYAGACIFEGTNVSEGRGTTLPFEYIGAPWLDAEALADRLSKKRMPGIHFRPVWFTPTFSKYAGERCAGVQMHLPEPENADPVAGALTLLDEIRDMAPGKLKWIREETGRYVIDLLLGTDSYRRGQDGPGLLAESEAARARFQEERKAFFLYE